MEAVRAFNMELQGVYENKPPISRAKMAAITKAAIKAIKFYKHVVQSVEKFIMKCRPEYKVPGLYVMDSIVRQSRHQFGMEKDVFAPRFSKNIVQTFQNLCRCPESERGKIVRVLNLWQKNNVFSPAVIQPLLDLCANPENPELFTKVQQLVQAATGLAPSVPQPKADSSRSVQQPAISKHVSSTQDDSVQKDVLKTVAQLLQQSQGPQQLSLSAQEQQLQQLQLLQQQLLQQSRILHEPQQAPTAPLIDGNLLAQISALTSTLLLKSKDEPAKSTSQPSFDKKLLDFDYGESDDEEEKRDSGGFKAPEPQESSLPGNVQNLLNDPDIMKHLHQMSETIQKTEQLKSELSMQEARQKMLEQQQEEFNQQIQRPSNPPEPPMPPRDSDPDIEIIDYRPPAFQSGPMAVPPPDDVDDRDRGHHHKRGFGRSRSRSRSRSRTPSKRRRHSRSRSRDRHHRSHSRDRRRARSRSRDRDRERREHERERRKKGLPPIKEGHLSICTLTLWLGHLSKQTTEDDVAAEISKYGQIESINLVPPRGCAFVCMNNRKDAAKALDRLKGIKILGNTIKVAWATNKGVKESSFKDGWDVDHGVTYIPYGRLPDSHVLEQLYDGGMVDEDSVPDFLKVAITSKPERVNTNQEGDTMDTSVSPQQQPSNVTLPADIPMPQMAPGMAAPMMPGPMMPGMMTPMMPMGMMPPPPMMMPSMSMPPPMPGMMPPPMPGPMPPAPPPMPPMVPPPVSSCPPVSMSMMAPPLPATPVMPPLPVSQPPQTTAVTVPQSEANKAVVMPPMAQAAIPPASQATVVESVPLPPVPPPSSISTSAGSQLAQAIQNIVAHSASITAVAGSTPGMIRPSTPQSQQSSTPVNTHTSFSPGAPPNFRAPNQPFDMQRAPASQSGPSPQGPPQSPGSYPAHGGQPGIGPREDTGSALTPDKPQPHFNAMGEWQGPGGSPLESPINRPAGFGVAGERGAEGMCQLGSMSRAGNMMGSRPAGAGFNQDGIREEGISRKDHSSSRSDLDEVFGGGGDKDERIICQHMGGMAARMSAPNQRMGAPSPGISGPNQRMGGPNHGMGGPGQRLIGPNQQVGGPNQRMGGPNQQRPMGPAGMNMPGQRMGAGPGMGGPGLGMGPRGPRGLGSMPNQNNMGSRLPSPNSMGGMPDSMGDLNSMAGGMPNTPQQGPTGPGSIQRNSGNMPGPGPRPGMVSNAGVMIMNPRGMSPGGMQGGGPRGPTPLLQRLSGPSNAGVPVTSLLRLPGPGAGGGGGGGGGGMMTRSPGGSGVRFSLRGPNAPGQHGMASQLGDLRPGGFNRFGSPRFGNSGHKEFGGRFGRDRERDRDWSHDRGRDRDRAARDHDRDRGKDYGREQHDEGHGREKGHEAGNDKTRDKDAGEEPPRNVDRDSRRTGKTRWNTVEESPPTPENDAAAKQQKDEPKTNGDGFDSAEPAVGQSCPSEARAASVASSSDAPSQGEPADRSSAPLEREPSRSESAASQQPRVPPHTAHDAELAQSERNPAALPPDSAAPHPDSAQPPPPPPAHLEYASQQQEGEKTKKHVPEPAWNDGTERTSAGDESAAAAKSQPEHVNMEVSDGETVQSAEKEPS